MIIWFKNLPVGKKFLYTFASLLTLILIISYTSYSGIHNLKTSLDQAEIRLRSYELLLQVDRDLQQTLVAERSLIYTKVGTPKFDEYLKHIKKIYSNRLKDGKSILV